MIPILPVLLKDFYKVGHPFQYPKDTSLIYSNFTPRGTRRPDSESIGGVIFFGLQYFIEEYLVRQFGDNFFDVSKGEVLDTYRRRLWNALGPDCITLDHIGDLHDLGYLPLRIKAVPEGSLVPYRVPALTIHNTEPEFYWLTNMVETLMSNVLWLPSTSATTAFGYRRRFEKYAKLTGADRDFVKWQGHDFSMRGLPGIEAACLSGAAHLLSFTGTDTIPAIDFLEEYYGADSDKELVGGSVPATEHSVMCMGMQDGEFETFRRLITKVYPQGIVSIVSDTWDFWKVLTDYLPRLWADVLAREGKVVIRPDSGNPVDIICGDSTSNVAHINAGAIATLYSVFGGKTNAAGYKELDPHIGLIYGDSITPARQNEILEKLAAKGFASSNVVLGIGSFTYQYVTRDTDGWAMKATYGERRHELGLDMPAGWQTVGQAISKDPATDNGVKKSASGLLRIGRGFPEPGPVDGTLYLQENCTWAEEATGELKTVFEDSVPYRVQTLAQIRAKVESQL
jgi:nicotinamide phosphoribosyltransferase